ncbi:1,4-dihydroxy-2-naphthoate polyprenyltransferase [Paeniglutamicibacter cryotolerans]|uniref:1,4-dihydroxy-2-naphthoate octaprenyltransferase n=1 Tax=Paeniglutamicibacter cryotolerans TaxID=670079 RepID=A0A839QDG6_9MICC|nr:1,4-dihydroxy-2-naphthoate polyprenyltransferase [Paeniglutamicibacter cryotolerans]MBB2994189.1 1,4-dihydroxy-2-naphthoate octaprenyltransferase [Paeniglutamicibacter cryotolerans]
MATTAQWVAGARLRTLPIAIAPVLIGTAAALDVSTEFHPARALLALAVALLLQIGVNYSNDYSDGIRGTDDVRVGPLRLTGSKLAKAEHVRNAAFACFGAAALAGVTLLWLSGTWWLLLVGVAAVFAAWGYTGGKKPYGYRGLGEVFVFLFFGPVATLGTTYTQVLQISWPALLGALGTGLIATALLMANNVRDIPTDKEVGKLTLAVRLGDARARASYPVMLGVAVLLPLLLLPTRPWALLVLLCLPLCIAPCRTMLRNHEPAGLIPVLKATGIINLVYAALFAAALVIGALARQA